jgi:hypothetical protein
MAALADITHHCHYEISLPIIYTLRRPVARTCQHHYEQDIGHQLIPEWQADPSRLLKQMEQRQGIAMLMLNQVRIQPRPWLFVCASCCPSQQQPRCVLHMSALASSC